MTRTRPKRSTQPPDAPTLTPTTPGGRTPARHYETCFPIPNPQALHRRERDVLRRNVPLRTKPNITQLASSSCP
jgi:hypothetical protein